MLKRSRVKPQAPCCPRTQLVRKVFSLLLLASDVAPEMLGSSTGRRLGVGVSTGLIVRADQELIVLFVIAPKAAGSRVLNFCRGAMRAVCMWEASASRFSTRGCNDRYCRMPAATLTPPLMSPQGAYLAPKGLKAPHLGWATGLLGVGQALFCCWAPSVRRSKAVRPGHRPTGNGMQNRDRTQKISQGARLIVN